MKRKIPATMATQHPDHASIPYWHTESFISTQFESLEAYLSYSDLGIEEYKWDWEGKLVDESILQRLFSNYFDFFKKKPLGWGGIYLTFRLPNPKVETEFRIGRSLMNLASAASEAKHFNLPSPPLFEVILPMTQTAEEMIAIQLAYRQLHKLKHPLYRLEGILTSPRIIPLFEDVPTIISSDKILEDYLKLHKQNFKKYPPYMRPYVARSDPALNYGIVPTVTAIKIALSRYKKLEKKLNLPFFPIIGASTLPFRGGLNPNNIEKFVKEYQGIKTTTIQSAFRYDFDKDIVKKAIKKLNQLLPANSALEIPEREEKELILVLPIFEKYYRSVIEAVSPIINQIAAYLPKRRERVQHVGLYGYSRGVGKVKLPRAIGFTAALYSIGIPPELIGTGRGLKKIVELKKLQLINKHYRFIKEDIIEAGRFLNKNNLKSLSQKSKVWKLVLQDVENLEKIFNIDLGPKGNEDNLHKTLTRKIYQKINALQNPSKLIIKAALIRKSLG